MDFAQRLDRALNPTILVNEAFELLDRVQWATTDPDVLARVAYTNSRKVFWKSLERIAKEVGDVSLLKAAQAQDPDILKQARKEAKDAAAERSISAPKGSELRKKEVAPDTLHMSPEQRVQDVLKKTAADKQVRTYPGDSVYGIFDTAGKLQQGGFYSQQEAELALGDLTKFPNPEGLTIKQYENPRSLSALKQTRAPLQQGWTTEEIWRALYPYVAMFARKYASNKAEFEDLVQHGGVAMMNALATDKGEAPFATHAYRHIAGEIRRAAVVGGVIRGADTPGGGSFGQKGANLGYEVIWQKDKNTPPQTKFFASDPSAFQDYFSKTGRHPPRSIDPGYKSAREFMTQLKADGVTLMSIRDKRGSMASTDVPIGGEEGGQSLGATIHSPRVKTPLQAAMTRDQVRRYATLANLTPQQQKVIELTFGMDEPETSIAPANYRNPEAGQPKEPGAQPGKTPEQAGFDPMSGGIKDKVQTARGPVEIGRMLGMSGERVRQHYARALQKLQKAAADASADAATTRAAALAARAAKQRGETPAAPVAAPAEDRACREALLAESVFRGLLFGMLVNGEIPGLIQE